MADSTGSVRLTGAAATAVAPSVASTKIASVKQTEVKGAPDTRPQSSRDFNTPPSKKVRTEEKSVKAKKLSREGVGGNGSSGEELQQPIKQKQPQPYGTSAAVWSFSQVKASSINHRVPATGGSHPPTNTHKVFKQSDFFLHKAPSTSSKPRKPSKDKQREKERENGKGGGEGKMKHKLVLTSGPGNNDIGRFINISAKKRENGEVMLAAKGRPSWCLLTEMLVRTDKVEVVCIERSLAGVGVFYSDLARRTF